MSETDELREYRAEQIAAEAGRRLAALHCESAEVCPLKPCPFCGGEAEVVELDGMYLHGFVARCANEECIIVAETDMYPTEAEAIAAWNTRIDYSTQKDNELRVKRREAERTCHMEPVWGTNALQCSERFPYLATEIVRCRDCKHGHEVTWPVQSEIPSDYRNCSGYLTETWDYYNDEPKDNPVPPDCFCKWGERRA